MSAADTLARREAELFAKPLARLGLRPVKRGIWSSCGDSDRVQGWKLHVSAVPGSALEVLSRVGELLASEGVAFKVASDRTVLEQLNEGSHGATQVGKFMTIYPADDGAARWLAGRLVELTEGLPGPVIATDLRLGDVVYARHGAFTPIVARNRLGQLQASIRDPDGSLRNDDYRVPFEPPAGVPNPFADWPLVAAGGPAAGGARSPELLGPGYLLTEMIASHPKGGVFQAIDLRSREGVAAVVLKQGRAHCLEDELGRDMRHRLRRQEEIHAELAGVVPIPRASPYFEADGDGYLPLELIDGRSLEALATATLRQRPWASVRRAKKLRLISHFAAALAAIERLHAAGWVHRDLTASNVWVGTDGRVHLFDLELAHRVDDPAPPLGLGTPGFMSPQQQRREPLAFADDVYGLGCVLLFLLTATDPRRLLWNGRGIEPARLQGLAGSLPAYVAAALSGAVEPDADQRIGLAELGAATERYRRELAGPPATGPRDEGEALTGPLIDEVLAAARDGLLEGVARSPRSGLWLSQEAAHGGAGADAEFRPLTLHRDANRGVAGVVLALSELARFGLATDPLRRRVEVAAEWLMADFDGAEEALPGLHFGEAGVAVALAEAVRAGLLDNRGRIARWIRAPLAAPLDWPDVTHGAAGQGIAALRCADALGEPALASHARDCSRFLIETQGADGSWRMPAGVEGMSGQVLSGFAHGVAGIVYFLVEAAHRFDDPAADAAWRRGADWLEAAAIAVPGGGLAWAYSDESAERWSWWCHGAPGISLAFLRAYERTGEERWAELARAALASVPATIRHYNLSQCHGLSGLGEIYLEAGRLLGGPWDRRARDVARTLVCLRGEGAGGGAIWVVEDPNLATADLMVGCGGIARFLLRLAVGATELGTPLLLEPVSQGRK